MSPRGGFVPGGRVVAYLSGVPERIAGQPRGSASVCLVWGCVDPLGAVPEVELDTEMSEKNHCDWIPFTRRARMRV